MVTTVEKKIKGRKREISTDTMGNLLCVKVYSAKKSDTMIGRDIIYQTFRKYSSVLAFCADQGFRGTTANFVKNDLKMRLDISVKNNEKKGFQVIPKRWAVERFFAWLGNFRRLSKDFEINPSVSEQIITIAGIVLLLNKLF